MRLNTCYQNFEVTTNEVTVIPDTFEQEEFYDDPTIEITTVEEDQSSDDEEITTVPMVRKTGAIVPVV